MRSSQILSAILLLLGTSTGSGGCSKGGAKDGNSADTGSNGEDGDSADDGRDTDTSGDDSATDALEVRWWRLAATLQLSGDLPDPKQSTLWVTPLDAEGQPLCEAPGAVPVLQAAALAPPSPEIFVWWSLELGSPAPLCPGVGSPLPEALLLGVGRMHPDILAAMAGVEGLDPGMPLNGAFVSRSSPAQELFVFGVAGPEGAFKDPGAGDTAAQQAPLADGPWQVRAVYWLDAGG